MKSDIDKLTDTFVSLHRNLPKMSTEDEKKWADDFNKRMEQPIDESLCFPLDLKISSDKIKI